MAGGLGEAHTDEYSGLFVVPRSRGCQVVARQSLALGWRHVVVLLVLRVLVVGLASALDYGFRWRCDGFKLWRIWCGPQW